MILWAAVIALGKAVGMGTMFFVIAWTGFATTAIVWALGTLDALMNPKRKHSSK